MTNDMDDAPAVRILAAWAELETALRATLPTCAVAPPTQPSELLSALRINHVIGPEEEERIVGLRRTRNRVAHQAGAPSAEVVVAYLVEVASLVASLRTRSAGPS